MHGRVERDPIALARRALVACPAASFFSWCSIGGRGLRVDERFGLELLPERGRNLFLQETEIGGDFGRLDATGDDGDYGRIGERELQCGCLQRDAVTTTDGLDAAGLVLNVFRGDAVAVAGPGTGPCGEDSRGIG